MRYLVINGSPHRGNTWKLALRAMDTIRAADATAEFDEVHLAEVKLPFCIGCSACFRLGHERCPHLGIVGDIMHKIEAADGVIVLSSTFNMRETAMLKNLFDHLCFLLHRPHYFRSKALVLTTTGGVGAKQAAKSIASFLRGIGFNSCYIIPVTALSWNDYQIGTKAALRLERATVRFQRDVASKKLHHPSLPVLIPYNLFRGMSLVYGKGSKYENQDGIHWAEECRRNSIYDPSVSAPFYMRPFAQLFYQIGKFAGKKVTVTYRKSRPEGGEAVSP